jgi:hypothetical protein
LEEITVGGDHREAAAFAIVHLNVDSLLNPVRRAQVGQAEFV